MTSMGWLLFALSTAAKASLVMAVAFIVTRMMRDRAPAERHLVWMLASVCVLALPVLALAGPQWRVLGVPAWVPGSGAAAHTHGGAHSVIITVPPTPTAVMPAVGGGVGHPPSAPPAAEIIPVPALAPEAPVAPRARMAPVAPVAPVAPAAPMPPPPLRSATPPARSSLPTTLLLFWLAGALLAGARMAGGFAHVRRIQRSARPLLDPVLLVRAHGIAADLGLGRPVRLLEGDDDAMPMTFGILRPTLLLPSAARSWPGARQTAVLRHELAHIRRRDSLSQLVAELACVLYWFNPLMWWAAWSMSIEREHACDDAVLAAGSPPSDYAAELLAVARTLRAQRSTAIAAIAMARPSHLRTRLAAVLEPRPRQAHASVKLLVPAWVGALLLVTPLSSLAPDLDRRIGAPADTRAAANVSASAHAGADEVAVVIPTVFPVAPRGAALPNAAPLPVVAGSVSAAGSGAGAPAATAPQDDCLTGSRNTSTSHNANNRNQTIKWSGTRCSGEVVIVGDIEFDRSFRTIAGISRGGSIRITTKEDGVERHLTVQNGGSGLERDYRVNGNRRAFDADAQRWQDATLLFLFRRLGFMAAERSLAMFQHDGTAAVLAEAEQMHSDYARARYTKTVIEHGRLDEPMLRRVLAQAGTSTKSDYYRSEIITAVAGNYTFTDGVRDAYLDAVSNMKSDYYRHTAIATLLEKGELSPAQMSAVLREGRRVGSDYYRATLLSDVAGRYRTTPEVRAAYLDAAAEIKSDFYKAQVLNGLFAGGGMSGAELTRIVNAAATIGSDFYRHELLSQVATTQGLDQDALLALIDASARISSDHYRSLVLVELARNHQLRGTARARYQEAMRGVRSDLYRGRVAEALLAN